MHKTLHKIPKGNFVPDENFQKFIKLSYTRFQKRKFMVTSFPKRKFYFILKFQKLDYTRFHKRKFRITVFPKKECYSLEKLLKLLHKRKFQLLNFLKRKFPKSDYTQNSIKGNFRSPTF